MHQTHKLSAQFDASLNNLEQVRLFLSEAAESFGIRKEVTDLMQVVVSEAIANTILHGYDGKPGTVRVEVETNTEALTIRLIDRASAFDPTKVPTPDVTLALEDRPFGGLGVHIMRNFTDSMTYQRSEEGENILSLIKYQPY